MFYSTGPGVCFTDTSSTCLYRLFLMQNLIHSDLINGEESASHGRSVKRLRSVATASVHLSLRHSVPTIRRFLIIPGNTELSANPETAKANRTVVCLTVVWAEFSSQSYVVRAKWRGRKFASKVENSAQILSYRQKFAHG